MREILGGSGYDQDELVAHFGLGSDTQVDSLEIRWPSGQTDVLTDIPADHRIRAFEGTETYHVIEPTTWEGSLPGTDTLVIGSLVNLAAVVCPALYEPSAKVTRVMADLSVIGGSAEEPLRESGDGAYVLETTVPEVRGPNRFTELAITVDQSTSLGPHWIRMSKSVVVVPGEDLVLYDEVMAPSWETSTKRVVNHDPAQTDLVHTGSAAWALQVEEHAQGWLLSLSAPEPLSLVGYEALSFCFHPGDVTPPSRPWFKLSSRSGFPVDLLRSSLVDLERREWQRVVIPMSGSSFGEELAYVRFSGNCGGTLYLDDIRLLATRPGSQPGTAVAEERGAPLPSAVSLAQNYPNPCNGSTTIRFSIAQQEEVGLTVYNLAGQEVKGLAQGHREAGTYALRWDGRDDDGRELASGVYLYRLQAGHQVETRKLVLVE